MTDDGQQCPTCRQYEVIVLDHGKDWKAAGTAVRRHPYCRNCDWGLCSGEC